MKTFTSTNQNGYDLVHIVGSKDDYTITENNGSISYVSDSWQRTYIVNGNEQLSFKRPDSQGKTKFKWVEEFAPFDMPSEYDILNDDSTLAYFPLIDQHEVLGNYTTSTIGTVDYSASGADFSSSVIYTGHGNSIDLTNDIGVSFWVKTTQNTVGHNLCFGIGDGTRFFFLDIRPDKNYFSLASENDSNSRVASPDMSDIIDGSWHHIIINRSGTEYSVYVDGVNITLQANDAYGSWNPFNTIGIGSGFDNTNKYGSFIGSLSKFRIFNRNLSSSDVSTLFNETF
jgi:hypothetical protein